MLGQHKLNKEIRETYAFTDENKLYLENSYGNIFLTGWDKNTIEIVVNIEAEGKNEDKAKKLLDRVKTDIIDNNNEVKIISKIEKNEGGFLGRYISKIDPFKNEKTFINYTIYLPKKSMVEVYNKYGDITISDWSGKLKTIVEHGDLRISNELKNAEITLKHAKLDVVELYESYIISKDATLEIHNGIDLKIDSDGSEMILNNIQNLELNANKDKIDIVKLNNISGDIKYSKTVFKTVGGKVKLNLYYGELRILKHIQNEPDFNINQQEAEVYINISETNFTFNAKLEQGVLRIPKTMENIESEIIDRKEKIRRISASYGAKQTGTITCTGYKGVIILKEL
ncbi:hypothetical protein [uncultured Kordia sp.]|uniref:hypothetical protein n=1 Tax=uncultured Kordia sp. TaxID=507699 RepID=UPI002617CBE5|nr:hypothetical protein [uncultured Kordia sp.]